MNISKDSPFFPKVILSLIRKNDNFKSLFQSTFPESYADVESYKINPNCSCKNRLGEVTDNAKDSVYLLFEGWVKDNRDVNIEEIVKTFTNTYLGGKVFRIENTEASLEEFYLKINSERGVFRGFSVVPEGDKLAIYFL